MTELRLNRFARLAWAVVAVNLLVIVWGAYVRASFSGDGCGDHWPLCNGEVLPATGIYKTFVEFTHRLTSGAALLLVVWLVVRASRAFPAGHRVRRGAAATLAFIIVEALIGAALVKYGLVVRNDSAARAVVMAGHLVNTFLLLAAATLTAWWATGGAAPRLRGQGNVGPLFAGALLGAMHSSTCFWQTSSGSRSCSRPRPRSRTRRWGARRPSRARDGRRSKSDAERHRRASARRIARSRRAKGQTKRSVPAHIRQRWFANLTASRPFNRRPRGEGSA
ncbi:MAG: COX15/CtaA family protein [Acidobacteria bacterium]|nr:COX15/CtaA family protein [Acidobacteriota bacterium]